MEPWITPQLFEAANEGFPRHPNLTFQVVDEYTWRAAPQGTHDRNALLTQHWKEWVTEDIIDTLHKAGITHLRVPVGYWYWNFSAAEPYGLTAGIHSQALDALKQMANEWASPRGMQVLLDMHTAPGSQNGFDNSGRRGDVNFFKSPKNLVLWETAVETMAKWAVANINKDALFGIEILNEPAGFYDEIWSAVQYIVNPSGYAAVREASKDIAVVFQTGFKSFGEEPQYEEPDYTNVWFDQHTYYCFPESENLNMLTAVGWDRHLGEACNEGSNYAQGTSKFRFAGGWSLATTDCTIYLSGGINGGCDFAEGPPPTQLRNPDCKYNGTLSRLGRDDVCQYYNAPMDKMPADYNDFLSKYARAQMDSFEAAGGWFFWNFRTENHHAPEWDYLAGIEGGWMPANAQGRERYCKPLPTPAPSPAQPSRAAVVV